MLKKNSGLTPHLLNYAWKKKKELLVQNRELVAVCPSEWLAKEALIGLWAGHRVEVIPNGLNLQKYKPLDREMARSALSIKKSGAVLLTAAQNWAEARKGGRILTEAIRNVWFLAISCQERS